MIRPLCILVLLATASAVVPKYLAIGQLAVIGIAYAAVALWWKRDCYRASIARPASAVIAASGIYWAVERSI